MHEEKANVIKCRFQQTSALHSFQAIEELCTCLILDDADATNGSNVLRAAVTPTKQRPRKRLGSKVDVMPVSNELPPMEKSPLAVAWCPHGILKGRPR